MRGGYWPDTPVRRGGAWVESATQGRMEVDALDLTSTMAGSLPQSISGAGGSVPASDGRVSWSSRDATTATGAVPDPWPEGATGWPLPPASPIRVFVGDASDVDEQPWVTLTGRVDTSAGRFTSATFTQEILDSIDQLDVRLDHVPLAELMPPVVEGEPYRYIGLDSLFFQDMAARAGRFYATPPALSDVAIEVPLMGSLWPLAGTCTRAGRHDDGTGLAYPSWDAVPWGLAARAAAATWTPTGGSTSAGTFIAQLCDPLAGTYIMFDLINDDNTGWYVRHDADTDTIIVGARTPSATSLATLPRAGALRVGLSFTRTNATVQMSDGRSATITHPNPQTGWVCSRVQLSGTGRAGGFTLHQVTNGWDGLTAAPTARFRATHNPLKAAPRLLDDRALNVLVGAATAQCASWWIDHEGVLQWAARGALEGGPVVGSFDSSRGLDDVAWTSTLEARRERVLLRHQTPWVAVSRQADRVLWQGGGDTLEADTEVWATEPSGEHWIMPDKSTTRVVSNSQAGQFNAGRGTWVGGTTSVGADEMVDHWTVSSEAVMSMEAVTDGSYKFTFTLGTVPVTGAVVLKTMKTPTNGFYTRFRDFNLPVLRGRGKIIFTEETQQSTVPGSTAPPGSTLEHDLGWWVQSQPLRDALRAWMIQQVTAPLARVDQVHIEYDPRVELGDKVAIDDRDVTGLHLEMVVERIDRSMSAASRSMSLGGRVTNATRPHTVPASTPARESWVALVQRISGGG